MDKLKHLKPQYVKVVKKGLTGDYDDEFFPNLQDKSYRHFSTKQEKSFYFLHRLEYKNYGINLRGKRRKMLISSWEDLSPFSAYGGKNWKHQSKRKHQYFRLKNLD